MTHGIKPPAAIEHTLIAGRELRKGEYSIDIPRDLVTRHGPYKVLNPSEALLLAGLCSLRPGKYVSKSRLFKAAGMDINQGRNVFARLVEKGFVLAVDRTWKIVLPERDEQPTTEQPKGTAEQPTAKKEIEEAAPEQPSQPLTAKKTPRPVKKNQGDVPGATSYVSHLVDAWNQHVTIGRHSVDAGGFPQEVVAYIDEFCGKYELSPVEFVTNAAQNLGRQQQKYQDATPSFVFNPRGSEYHQDLFYDEIKVINQRLSAQREEEFMQDAYDMIVLAANEQGVAPPSRERLENGWTGNPMFRKVHETVMLSPGEVLDDIRMIVRGSSTNDTPEGLTKVYGSLTPTDDERHQRNRELVRKIFYTVASNVGANRMGEYPDKTIRSESFDHLMEAVNWWD